MGEIGRRRSILRDQRDVRVLPVLVHKGLPGLLRLWVVAVPLMVLLTVAGRLLGRAFSGGELDSAELTVVASLPILMTVMFVCSGMVAKDRARSPGHREGSGAKVSTIAMVAVLAGLAVALPVAVLAWVEFTGVMSARWVVLQGVGGLLVAMTVPLVVRAAPTVAATECSASVAMRTSLDVRGKYRSLLSVTLPVYRSRFPGHSSRLL
jgi:hypothetical protein